MMTPKNPLPVTDRHSPYFTNMGGGEQEVIDVTDLAPQRKTPRTVDELIDQVFESSMSRYLIYGWSDLIDWWLAGNSWASLLQARREFKEKGMWR